MNNNERADIHNGIAWAIIIAFAAIIMSIIAVAHKVPRYNLDFDYLGLLVGILAFITAILIGWQIAQTFIAREKLQNIDDVISYKTNHAVHFNLFHLFLYQGQNAEDRNQMTNALNCYFRCLDCICKGDLDIKSTDDILHKINTIQNIENIRISPKDCNIYKAILSQLNNPKCEGISSTLDGITDETQPSQADTWIQTEKITNKPLSPWH